MDTYRVTRLASTRLRILGTKGYFESKAYIPIPCTTCALPFGMHAASYAGEAPFLMDDGDTTTALAVPGVVMDIECLPIDKREMFERQFSGELRAWREGKDAPILNLFESMTMPQRSAPVPPTAPVIEPVWKYQGEIDLTPQRAKAPSIRFSEEEARDPRVKFLLEMMKLALADGNEGVSIEAGQQLRARLKELRLEAAARSAPYQGGAAGPYDREFWDTKMTARQEERALAAKVTTIAVKRKMFDDG